MVVSLAIAFVQGEIAPTAMKQFPRDYAQLSRGCARSVNADSLTERSKAGLQVTQGAQHGASEAQRNSDGQELS
jgi:hypothetical protein